MLIFKFQQSVKLKAKINLKTFKSAWTISLDSLSSKGCRKKNFLRMVQMIREKTKECDER